MTALINASNTSGITFTSDTSGNVAIQSNGTTVVTIAGTGANAGVQMGAAFAPTFWAYANTLQSISSSTNTLVKFGTKVFDTAGCFNNTGSTVTLNGLSVPAYAFAPNVAGYYQVNATFQPNTVVTRAFTSIRKNGALALSGDDISATQLSSVQVSGIIYLNGTGDYIQIYGLLTGTSPQIYGGAASSDAAYTLFQAAMIRSA